ncbi:MAG: hypothetical protein L0219_09480 [Phycisphaerales bacterium]|nr:hypothetical protein [Phycisphaerales bacterium]MCI0675554.1 hypothetical protein [Phycisphaerales bacterium]
MDGRSCPECGREFDPGNEATFLARPLSGRRYLSWNVLGLGLLVLPFFVAELGSAAYLFLPGAGVILVLAALWRNRRGVMLRHRWIEGRAAFWSGLGVGVLTLLIAMGMVWVAWSIARG